MEVKKKGRKPVNGLMEYSNMYRKVELGSYRIGGKDRKLRLLDDIKSGGYNWRLYDDDWL